MPQIDQIKHGIKTVTTLYPENRKPGLANTSLKTILVYTENIVKYPSEKKFWQINSTNEAY